MRSGRVIVLLAVVGLLVVTPARAARLFNGTNQSLQSASAIDLSGQSKVSLSFWLWVDAFTNGNGVSFETGTTFANPNNGILSEPDDGTNHAGTWLVGHDGTGGGTLSLFYFTRPSAAAWHHYVVELDRTLATNEVVAVYIDGVSVARTAFVNNDTPGNFCNCTFNFMSRNNTSLWLAGRQAEFAVWSVLLSQSDVTALYSGGAGALATSVQSGSLLAYWRIQGLQSPEPATVGGVNLTVNGATFTAHPFLDPAPSSKPPKSPRSGSRGRGR